MVKVLPLQSYGLGLTDISLDEIKQAINDLETS